MYLTELIDALPKRVRSACFDQISLVILGSFIWTLVDFFTLSSKAATNSDVNSAILYFSIFVNKDICFGKSLGKYFTGLRVTSFRTGRPASPIQCSVRNLFILLWPVEAVFLFVSPNRRLGDFVAGTRVVEDNLHFEKKDWSYFKAFIAVVFSFLLIYHLFYFIDGFGIMG